MASAFVTKYVLDPLERAGSTFVQQFAVVLLATGSGGLLLQQNWQVAGLTALFAAALSIIMWAAQLPLGVLPGKLDLIARVVKTFLASFGATLIASGATDVVHASWQAAAAIGFTAAMTALIKGLIAFNKPGTITAASLVSGPDLAHAEYSGQHENVEHNGVANAG
jgi:hypothetical protein